MAASAQTLQKWLLKGIHTNSAEVPRKQNLPTPLNVYGLFEKLARIVYPLQLQDSLPLSLLCVVFPRHTLGEKLPTAASTLPMKELLHSTVVKPLLSRLSKLSYPALESFFTLIPASFFSLKTMGQLGAVEVVQELAVGVDLFAAFRKFEF